MVLGLKQGEGVIGAKAKRGPNPKMVVEEPNPGEEVVGAKKRPGLKPVSLFPAKRRSVKRMIYDDFVKFFTSLFCPRPPPPSSGVPLSTKGSDPTPPKASKAEKNKEGMFSDP